MSMSVVFGYCCQVPPFKFIASKLYLDLRLSEDEGLYKGFASGERGKLETKKGRSDEVIEMRKR